MAELNLRLQLEGNIEKTVTVDQNEFTIGRSPECNLHLPYGSISRCHARFIKTDNGSWIIEDLGSKNGTKLNDQQVLSPALIKHGDLINLGNIYLTILLNPVERVAVCAPARRTERLPEPIGPGMTILRNAKDLQKQWIDADADGDNLNNKEKAIDRLKYLVDIAKGLNYAESIEAIFSQVQKVVFRELSSIDRLALLIDTTGTGKLELLNCATRDASQQHYLPANATWISRSICQKVFAEKLAIQTADAQMDKRFEDELSIIANNIHSAMAVPLWDETKVVGVLYADAHLSFSNWTEGGEDDLSFFSTLANLVASSVQRWLLTRKLRSEETIRHRLERYHSPGVVQQMMAEGALEAGRIPPKEEDISILFADIVGFTALSERLSPAEIAELLNDFFEEMLQEVFAAGGTLDKFIGDCIMAFFGAPEPQQDHADRAVAAATGMLNRLSYLNANNLLREPLQLRIAINSGKAVVGDVGSHARVDYTVLGATINQASRMEAICPPGECVISETTYGLLQSPQDFILMDEYRFKGIDRPVLVYQTKRHSS